MATIPLLALLATLLSAAPGREQTVTVRAPDRDYRQVLVRVVLAAPKQPASAAASDWRAEVRRDGRPVPAQARPVGAGQYEVAWIVPALKQGETLTYTAALRTTEALSGPPDAVKVQEKDRNLEIRFGDSLFTRYDTTTGPNKPYFYPLYAPGEKLLVRRYPLETVEGETRDHPHHRGLWFTHGAVNGADFWTEGGSAAKTVHRAYEQAQSGPVYGYFRAVTNWIGHDGRKIAEDTREVTAWETADGRFMDFTVTVKATEGPLVFGDTKEGSFGLRLPDTMRVAGGQGHIESSEGVKDAATWGQRAAWVDYYGPVDGETVGVAIMDAPTNFRHPTWWHVRDYGLFAVNPFGIHDFEKGKAADAGNHAVPAGGALTMRYRLFFHRGDTAAARVADAWAAFAQPPTVEAR